MTSYISAAYLASVILFILSIRGLAHPATARHGNILGFIGMSLAVLATFFMPGMDDYFWTFFMILTGGFLGLFFAFRVKMTSLPQMIAAFNGLGGLASVFIAVAEILSDTLTKF